MDVRCRMTPAEYIVWSWLVLEAPNTSTVQTPRTLVYVCNAHACKNITKRFKHDFFLKKFCKRTWDIVRQCICRKQLFQLISLFRFLCFNKSFCVASLKSGSQVELIKPIQMLSCSMEDIDGILEHHVNLLEQHEEHEPLPLEICGIIFLHVYV